ncbi:MAG: aminotransferase class V-fold PLP-dependent enzyme [Gemmatimonadota bacterium]
MEHLPAHLRRRDFVRLSGLAAVAHVLPGAPPNATGADPTDLAEWSSLSAEHAAQDDAFWQRVRALYTPPDGFLDFDNANAGAVPASVVSSYVRHVRDLNGAPNVFYPRLNNYMETYDRLAALLDTTTDEIALLPNATTGLNSVLRGFPLQPGDEVLVTNHEYPDMVETLALRARRDGIVVRTVAVPDLEENALRLVDAMERTITPRTKLMLVSHTSAWTGEVLPVKEVCTAARARGVAVLVDAAQSLGYLDVTCNRWGCDFMAASLHKGMGAPLATGVLVMRKEWIGQVEPLHPPTWDTSKYPIDQYAWTGTANVAATAAIADAIAVQQQIGIARKRARLQRLASYWHERVRDVPGLSLLTPPAPSRSFGFSSFAIDGIPSREVAERMRRDYKILVQDKASRPHRPVENAVRVSPQPYTTWRELDRLVAAITTIAQGRA